MAYDKRGKGSGAAWNERKRKAPAQQRNEGPQWPNKSKEGNATGFFPQSARGKAPYSRFNREAPRPGKPSEARRSGQSDRLERQECRYFPEPRGRKEWQIRKPQLPRPSYPADGAERLNESELPRDNMLVGRNPIREALKSGRDIEKLLIARGDLFGSARELVALARERRIVVQEVDRIRLDALSPGHQGMIAFASAFRYASIEDMFKAAEQRNQPPLLIILDGITDPHNLGAIIRTAECAGAHGVIVAERRAVGLTPAAVKASAGAVEHLPVARVVNIPRAIEQLKSKGLWIFAAVADGERYDRCDLSGAAALVIGSEGEGISRLAMEKCDHRLSLPLCGQIGSLNASVTAGVLLYEILRQRRL